MNVKIVSAIKRSIEANCGGFSAEHESAKNEEALFELFKNKETGALHMGTFLSALRNTGLRKSDPRLREMMDNLKQIQRRNSDGFTVDTHKLNLQQFRRWTIRPPFSLTHRFVF